MTILFILSLSTFIIGNLYKIVFKKFDTKNDVPTGFGIILISLLTFTLNLTLDGNVNNLKIIFLIINCSTLFYFLDDIFHLKPIIRISLIVLTSIILFIKSYYVQSLVESSDFYLLYLIIFILFSVLSVNVFNFYDGVDLNLSSIIFFIGILSASLGYGDSNYYALIGKSLIALSLGFSAINMYPKSLYLGDSGSFAIAFVYLILLLSSLNNSPILFVSLLTLMSLPTFDVLYVLLIRIKSSHNLLSRNYLHLYQRVQIKYGKFYHLLLTPLNAIILFTTAYLISKLGINFMNTSLICIFLVTPFNYLLFRYNLIEKKYFFGDEKI